MDTNVNEGGFGMIKGAVQVSVARSASGTGWCIELSTPTASASATLRNAVQAKALARRMFEAATGNAVDNDFALLMGVAA